MTDATIYSGIIVAAVAFLGVLFTYLKVSGRTKYVEAIPVALDAMQDTVMYIQLVTKAAAEGGQLDQAALNAKGEEILRHIKEIQADLAT